jgi:hypothetical protein
VIDSSKHILIGSKSFFCLQIVNNSIKSSLVSNKDVIDRDVNKLDKKSNKSHDQKSNSSSPGNSSEFFTIGLGTFLDKVDGVLGKLTERLDENLVESFLLSHFEVCFVCVFYEMIRLR